MVTSRSDLALVVFAVSRCGGCAVDEPGDARAAAGIGRAADPVVVTLGGYNSCVASPSGPTPAGSDRWNKSARLTRRFSRGDPQWVRACFDDRGRLYWLSSVAPTLVRSTTTDALAPFFVAVAARLGREGRPLYVLGHSYGGWLAMHTVWSLPASADVRLLFTVDPISPAQCTAASYVRAAASPASAPWHLAGCQRAPTDFSPAARREVRGHLPDGGWRHYYQRNFLPLRSGPFDGAPQPHRSYDVSPFLTHNGGAHPSWNAHTGIDELAVVWYSFEASIEHDLAGR